MEQVMDQEPREGEVIVTYREGGRVRTTPIVTHGAAVATSVVVGTIVDLLETATAPLSDHLSDREVGTLTDYPQATADEVATVLGAAARGQFRLAQQSLSTAEVGALLDVDPSRIRQRLDDGSIWGFKYGDNAWRIPRWQFAHGALIPGISIVNRSFRPDLDPRTVEGFLASQSVDLVVAGSRVTPLEWLNAGGDPEPVALIAANL